MAVLWVPDLPSLHPQGALERRFKSVPHQEEPPGPVQIPNEEAKANQVGGGIDRQVRPLEVRQLAINSANHHRPQCPVHRQSKQRPNCVLRLDLSFGLPSLRMYFLLLCTLLQAQNARCWYCHGKATCSLSVCFSMP